MVTVFFGVNGRGLVKILPEGTKLTSEHFKDPVLQEIYQGSRGSWRLGRPTHLTVHDDNAPLHHARRVSKRLREDGFIRLVHPSDSPDRALKQSAYRTPDELEDVIVRRIEDVPREALLDVFASWGRRLETYMERDVDYFEETLSEYAEK
jgi:hypothetical protein